MGDDNGVLLRLYKTSIGNSRYFGGEGYKKLI